MEVIQGFRLSPQQRRVWLLQRDSRAYRSQCAISIDGPLDISVLKDTVYRLIERHEILRTTFECLPGMKIPVQVTKDEVTHSLCEVDFSDQPVAERNSLVDQLFDEMHLQTFDTVLSVAGRYTLVRLSPVEHVLIISVPSLCADKQTLNNLLGEISRLYLESEETEETVQYAQFSEWQHELLEENDDDAGREFWRKQASFSAPTLKLPLESTPTEISTFAPRTHTLVLADDIVVNGVFLFTCWQSLLQRLTKQNDIAVRYLCNGRVYEEMSDAFGLYDRWPLLHSQFEEDQPFTKVLEQIDRTVTDAREWQEYYPGGDEVDESIGFDFTEQPAARVAGDLRFSITRQYSCTERMKLRLSCIRTEHALIAEFHYDPSFYSEPVIENLAGRFASLVRSAASRPESPISELEIIGDRERQKLLVEWNATQAEFERDATIQQMFETQAALTPDALAVLCDDQKLSFHELNCRANQLARHLRSLGVGAETRVALCVERSLDMIVGLLGILKAGGAYVPLDAAQPASRLSFMLEDTQAGVLLTQESLNSLLPAHNARVVCIDTDSHAIAQHDSSNLPCQTTAQNLAYMIYTSGSTGRPKGTMIEHRSVINLLGALKRTVYTDVERALRVSVNAPLAFDSSVKQVIQLLSGHALCVIPEEVRRDGARMLRYLSEHEVDVLDCTPSQLRLLLSAGLGTDDQLAVRRVLVGGEAIDAALWLELAAQDSIAYFNVYGPTECTVDTTVRHITKEQSEPTLGRAINNVQVYLLDDQQQLVPVGMTGEICIGGEGVGRGYHNSAALTAEKFLPDPFSLNAGARLYRTGDAARYTATGELEYVGRLDGQVKIRGSRIELGEVEVALSAHPGVQTCVVVAREDTQGSARLVAYVVLYESESSSVRELRTFLTEKLPEYMIPSVVMFLEQMPLTPNGKINRQALPAPGQVRSDDEEFAAPRTPGEGILASMWEHLLGVERVGINDDFFELGGHSLLAMQLISRVREAFQIEIPLPALFAAPTVATLAVKIEEIIKAGDGLLAPPIRPVSRVGHMPLSFAQMRLWFLHQLDPASVLYNLPLAIRLRGGVNVPAMEQTLTEIVRRHEVLRTTYATSGGQPVQVINPPQPFGLPIVDLSALPADQREAEARRLATAEAMRPFNLSEGPLMRVTFLALDEDEYLALFTMHHITSDGWSMALLTREVAVLYDAFSAGAASPLPELPVQYADFAQWQRNWLRGEVLDAHLDFWKQQLDGAPPVHQLPTDRPRPAVPTYRGSNLPLTLSTDVTATLKALSREEGVTVFMTLLAAFQTLLYRYSGSPDVVVGTGIAGRNRAEIEGLLGFFVNSLVLRTDLSGNPTFRELLARVREVTLGAYAHQEMPFEVLVEALQPERNLNYNPLFQVMVILQNTPRKASGVSGLSLSSREVEIGTSKFDLYLVISEGTDRIGFGLEYTTDLFDESTIRRMLSHFDNLFQAICANPDTPVQELSLLSPEESRHLLCDFNPQAPDLPPAICLHQLFEAQAACNPEALAISYDGFHLPYGKINARANRLAHHLRSLGVGPEDRVAVLLDRTPDLVIAILGILKAGAAYLPLDPAYPQERLSYMLSDAGAQVIVTEQALVEPWLLQQTQLTVVHLDDPVVAAAPSSNLIAAEVGVRPENAAYVIYTSGSTGQPKGVVVTHENVWRLMEVTRTDFKFDERDVWTLFHSVCFDFSVWELWGPLTHGGRLVVVPYWVSREPEAFYELLKEEKVTVLNQTPSAFRQLMKVDETVGGELSLRAVIFGGEALEMSTLRGWFERHGDERPRLVNMYGITETTVHVTYRELSARDTEGGSVIGDALGDLELYVLDEQMRAVPEGVSGEMYVGGGGVARGYLGRAELTAQRFVPHPYSERAGVRLYRTGDLARRRADGELEYLGRIDDQVKIRGFRIELGEIANALREQAGVRESVVLALGAGGEEKRLVGYVVADEGVNAGELREELKQRLPDYMIPSAIVLLAETPLTRNGKVDRRALPAPEEVWSEGETEFVAPRTPAEEVLAGIWSDVLRTTRIGVNDNFFELGGHSLLATQVISRIREAFSIEIPVRAIFEKPTLAMLAADIEQLMYQGGSLHAAPLMRTSREVELPLSFAQQRLWFIDRLTPGSPLYNMPLAVRLDGTLNLAALERTLREIVRRHEVLRTSFVTVEGKPVQVIRPEAHADQFCLPLVDLGSLPETLREAEAKRLASAEAVRPFDLETDSLLRATVLRLDAQQHIALLTFHHIASDGWSMGVLVKEVAALYNAFSQGLASPLAELPVQYADYAVWQREWLQGEVLDQQIGYWKQQLAGAPELLELPTDRPRPAVQTHHGARVGMMLSPELTAKLRELCRAEGATLFMLLLAALKVLLARYTGQEDISVGTPIAGRNRVETEGLIGFFVNTLVLRTDLSSNPTVRELVRRVREVALGAYAHQELPFEKLVDELQVERSLSHTPFFQVVFVLQNTTQELLELPGLSLSAAGEASGGVAKYDLTVNVSESGDVISGVWEYNTDLFDETTIQRMLSHFQNLLQAICADADTPVQELSLLSPEESRHLLCDFNPQAPALPPAVCLHQLFEAQAAHSPHSLALSCEGLHLSYGEVNERANRLAHHLRSLGVGPEQRVAVLLDRTSDLVVAILGILKAGAAYLPLDPAYPQERLSFMLADAGAQVVVTEQTLVEPWLLDSQTTLVCLDDQVLAATASTNLSAAEVGVRAENAAYVIYTSGSTGQPKGVVVTHENVWRLLEVTRADFAFDSSDVWTLFHSVCFDFSVWELFGPLAYGARLVVVPYWVSREPEAFYELLKEEKVTVLNQTPSAFRQLMKVDEAVGGDLALRVVIFGGEALEMSTLRGWFERHGEERPRLVNMYGITETTVHVTYRELSARDTEGGSVIGGALGDLEVYVLDEQMRAVPEGVSGELYVGGAGVARGYLGRAELTAQRFVPHPYSERTGARLYRTGDLARRRADGELEYLGRIDDQVKIRGFRIELGEIANALREQAGVRESVVLALGASGEEKRLVGYVVADGGVNASELREELKQRLPDYMIPAAIVLLAAMPLTRNGKVDRRALPTPEEVSSEDFVAPRTPVEEVLASIWCDVLRTTRIGVNDNFFELGGHSLLAIQVVSRIREAFAIEIPVRAIFENPTIAMLAVGIEQLMYQGGSLLAPPLVRTSREVEPPLSFAQQRLWFIDRLTPGSPLYNMPMAVRLDGALNLDALERTLREIVRRHEVLRTSFTIIDGQPVQVIRPEAHADQFCLPLVDLSSLPKALREAEANRLAHAEAASPFDLETDALMRTTVLRLDDEQHIALLTLHHIVSDGWSMGVFVKEVATLYNAFSQGLMSPLAELPVQYADYAVWQREWLQGEVLDQQIGYWKQQLESAPELLELPADRPRPAVQTHRGASVGMVLSPELSAKLRELCRAEGATLFMLLLAALKVLLARYTGQADISVGTTIAGRNRVETEGLIGFFVNTLVLRTDLSGNPSARELVRRVREVALGAYAHQELPFEKLVDELQVERSLSHTPLFQVVFQLQNNTQELLALPGLSLSAVGETSDLAKFDLTLNMSESGEAISGAVQYNTDLFDETTIQRMLSHFQNLLQAICADPNASLQELSLLSAEESRHLLCDFNPQAPALPPAVCLHQLFEAQAARWANSPALSCDGLHLSYGEVNERANRLAHHLRSLGVGPEQRVAVLLDRTSDLVIAILGILKAGAAYLPLDPAYPQERLSFMLGDAGAQVIVTEQALVEPWLLQQAELTVVHLDDPVVAAAPSSNLSAAEVGVRAENAAYVIYTSGSTGQPKGVVVTHENVWRLLEVTRNDFQFDSSDVWTLFHSVCFDFSVWELWGPLTHGGRLVVVPYWVSREPEAFYELLREEKVTVLNQTPSAFRQLMKVDEVVGGELALRTVIFGGEALEMSTLRGWFERHGEERPRLVNMYGITETTVHVTYRELSARDTEGGSVIGNSLGDLELYVLDEQMRAVPEGVSGEMFVGGGGVARGYLGRAELTAQRFVPHPYSERAGARLYRTGDLARRRSDGELEYLGRIDDQVKIRGFRIELGEIANALREQAGVRESVVLALGAGGEEKRLVGYVVADEGVNAGELREQLKQRLPDYMIPSAIVMLEALPLTRNGKVDRRALPAPEEVSSEGEENFVAPRTPIEEVLAGIWSDVLRTTRIGVNDNFFELSGHSLLAIQVVSRIREAFAVEIPVRAIFESPTIAMLAVDIEQQMYQGGSFQAAPLVRTSRDVELPLSFAQQRLWFIDRLTPESPLYNMPLAVRLDGALNLDALERTLREIVRRHEVLRTSFVTVEGKPVQVIRPEAQAQEFYLPLVDLSSLPEDLREAEAKRLGQAEAIRPFDLAAESLLRTTVLRLDDQQHIALLTFHHIVSDGWSMGVLVKEVAALYNAFSQGVASPLAELPVQYADYAVWQREWLQGEVLEQQIGYWKQQLEGAPELLELPTDRPRPAVQTHHGASVGMVLSPELTAKVRELCRAESATLFMLLLAVFKVLLARYTGQADISVGTPIAGRNRVETEGLIGFFVNTLVLRTDLSGNPTVHELIRRVREVALGAYAHQELPFEKLVDELQVERSLSHTPLFQVVFALQNAGQDVLELPGLSLSAAGDASDVAKFDLMLSLSESDEAISGALQYNTDLFEATTIKRMLMHFQTLLESIITNPNQTVASLPMLADSERQLILNNWNDTERPFPSDLCVHQLFEAQVLASPDSNALICDDLRLSYRELNDRANQLAHHLRRLGVGMESAIGILMERNADLIVSLLAILKAGGCYLPVDPDYPQERVSFMLRDADVRVLLTQSHLLEKLPEHDAHAVLVDADWPAIEQEMTENLTLSTQAENVAYVIYTSGSTGEPKGVEVTHRNIARLLFGVDYVCLDARPRILQMASISFDASTFEVWGALLHGGCCVLYPERVPNYEGIGNCIARHEIDVMWMTASLFNAVVDEAPQALRGVGQLLVGGEALSVEHIRRAQQALPGVQLTNGYGPTESTTFACCHPIEEVREEERAIPIGRAIGNTQAYILDREMEVVGVGIRGELYLGGEGLARGYLKRSGLTAERFVPNPFSERGGERLYRTGDVCRYREDGTIEYVGRVDEQVKVRGFRIELGEIETVLAKAEGVAEAVVVVRQQAGDKRLVAYVVGEKGRELSASEMRNYLAGRLPDYMIPAAFVVMEEMPITANGKVDKKKLPEPTNERPSLASEFIKPQTETELRIAAIWQELLHLSEIGTEDNFFDLGGNSLLLVQLHARLQKIYGEQVTMVDLFEHPTVGSLAAQLSKEEPSPEQAERQAARFEKRMTGKQRQRQRLEQRKRALKGGEDLND